MAKDLFDLSGKIAVVTGASRGIGEAIALGLARKGAHVIVSSRKEDSCRRVVEAIAAEGGKAEAVPCHIGETAQIDALFETLQKRHGRLDILINNAAANPYFGPIVDTGLDAFQKAVDVNIRGYFFMSAKGAKLMAKNGGGSIVNVASIAGVLPTPAAGIYSVSKAAVISMTKAFASECGKDNVRVNAILPGPTATKFAAALVENPDIRAEALTRLPLKKIAVPEEMVTTALYLVSDASSFTTGACINVDGGFLSN